MTVLEVIHETRYEYAAMVSLAHHLAHLRPLDDDAQRVLDFDLVVTPEPDQRHESADAFGNTQCHFSLLSPHDHLEIGRAHV